MVTALISAGTCTVRTCVDQDHYTHKVRSPSAGGEDTSDVGVGAELAVVGLMLPVGTTSFGPVRISVVASSVKLIIYTTPASVHTYTLPGIWQWL